MNQYVEASSVSDHYALIWRSSLDSVIEDMKLRFSNDRPHLLALEKLIPSRMDSKTNSSEVAKTLQQRYQRFFNDVSFIELEREIDRWVKKWSNVDHDEKPHTAITTLDHSSLYPTVEKLLIILATLPVSTAEVERVFSKVDRTKTGIRSRMTVNRLESLILIQSHREHLPNHDSIVNEFCKKNRRISFG